MAVVVYDGLCTFEFGVAYEVFGLSRPELGPGWYRFATASIGERSMRAAGGLAVTADGGEELLAEASLIVIPGWRSADAPVPEALQEALRQAVRRGARIATLCSGVFVPAAAGLLDGKRATTHWRYAEALGARHPLIAIDADVLYVDNGDILTAAGSAAGIDLCLTSSARISASPPPTASRAGWSFPASRRRPGAVHPAPVPRPREGERLGALLDWIERNLGADLSIAALARRAGMSVRTFQRRFEETTGQSPGDFVAAARTARAQALLEARPDIPLDEAAALAGFGSPETMRRHFRERIKTSPQAWRARFTGSSAAQPS